MCTSGVRPGHPHGRGERAALEELRLTLRADEALALIGHNGSGKTTALRTIGGLLTPTEGSVRVGGADPHTEPEAAEARKLTAFVSDAPVFYRDLTVAEHVFLVAVAHGTADPAAVDAVLTARTSRTWRPASTTRTPSPAPRRPRPTTARCC